MTEAADEDRLELLARPLGARFQRRVVTIAPGATRPYDAADWDDALILLERGQIHIECQAGGFRQFGQGAVLCLTGMALRALHNRGTETALLVAISRNRTNCSE